MADGNVFIYPKDADAFGSERGRQTLTVAPELNGASRFSNGVADLPSGKGHAQHNHRYSNELKFVIPGEGAQIVEDENGGPVPKSCLTDKSGCQLFLIDEKLSPFKCPRPTFSKEETCS